MTQFWMKAIAGGLASGALGVAVIWLGGPWVLAIGATVITMYVIGFGLVVHGEKMPEKLAAAFAFGKAEEATRTLGESEREAAQRAAEYWAAVRDAQAGGQAHSAGIAFSVETAAICGAEHVYDAATNTACPKCGQLDRVTLGRSLRAREAAAMLR